MGQQQLSQLHNVKQCILDCVTNKILYILPTFCIVSYCRESLHSVGMSAAGGRGLGSQYYSLRWNNHPVNLVTVFTGLYQVSQQPALGSCRLVRVHAQARKFSFSKICT